MYVQCSVITRNPYNVQHTLSSNFINIPNQCPFSMSTKTAELTNG